MSQKINRGFDGDGMTLPEIAEELGISYNEVRNTLYRAMRKLRLGTIARGEVAELYYDTERERLGERREA